MKKTSVVLVFDIGTQSTRALLVSSEGKILAKAQKGHHTAYVSRKSGWAEQDPDFYYQNLCRVSRQLRESFPDIFAQIRAVTLTTIVVPVSALDGTENLCALQFYGWIREELQVRLR